MTGNQHKIRIFLVWMLVLLTAFSGMGSGTAKAEMVFETPQITADQELTYFSLDEIENSSGLNKVEPVVPADTPEMLDVPAPVPGEEEETVSLEPAYAQGESRGSGAALMSVEQLRSKFPDGTYWNHATNPGFEEQRNNPDGWTTVPCPEHHDEEPGQYLASGINTCNTFYYNGVPIGSQCYGYAAKLGYDVTGTCMEDWNIITDPAAAMQAVKPGDILRINQDHHSVYVIAVKDDEIMYTDCNEGQQCAIHWNTRMTKASAAEKLTRLHQSPVEVPWGGAGPCWCSGEMGGLYRTRAAVPLRNGHGTGYDTLRTVPADAVVQVTKGDENWAHVVFEGMTGYLPSAALVRSDTPPEIYLIRNDDGYIYSGFNFSVPDQPYFDMIVYCDGNLPNRFRLMTAVPDNTPGFFRLEFLGWNPDGKSANVRIIALAGGRTDLTFQIADEATGEIVAAKNFIINATLRTAALGASATYLGLDLEGTASQRVTLIKAGYVPDDYEIILWAASGNNFRVDWDGTWNDGQYDVGITGVRPGAGRAVFALLCQGTVLASREVIIHVFGPTVMEPTFRSVVLSSTVPRELPMRIQIWTDPTMQYGMGITRNSGAFTIKDGAWDTSDGLFAFSVTVIPLETGEGVLTFSLTDAATGNVVRTLELPIRVVPRPVYLIQYDLRGGTDAPTLNLVPEDGQLTDEAPRREDYIFSGWATDPDRLTVQYQAGSQFRGRTDCTMYAVWSPRLEGSILEMPASVTTVEEEAFAGISARNVVINADCASIESDAFADSRRLAAVVIPNPYTEIDPDAFSGCGQLRIYGKEGSTAQQFAEEQNHLFFELD